ncbi:MAG: hypothetical protein KME52_26830 [Desmonostoc geniculatum HA4340-LM1]|nr:hypothetical protein [Desmonostoc geniculatum HA4340-LM1]
MTMVFGISLCLSYRIAEIYYVCCAIAGNTFKFILKSIAIATQPTIKFL